MNLVALNTRSRNGYHPMTAERREHQFKLGQHKPPREVSVGRQVHFIAKNRAILGEYCMHEGTETFKKYYIFRN